MAQAENKNKTKASKSVRDMLKFIHQYCESHRDETIVKKYTRFFREGFDAYGLSSAAYEECIAAMKDKFNPSLEMVLEVAPHLVKGGKYEEVNIVIRLVKEHSQEFSSETFCDIESWFHVGISNWAHADILAGDVTPVFLVNNIVQLNAFEPWRKGENKYQRRVSAVTLIKLLKEKQDITRLLKFIEPLMTDTAREVQQGVGWFLREAWKIDKIPVEQFLSKWKDDSPRLIFQYACEKMTPAEKQRFKKGAPDSGKKK